MPPLAASRYFLTGEVFTAAEAVAAGLVTIACPAAEVAARVAALTDEIRRTAPGVVAETKRLLTELPAHSLADGFELAAATSARLFASDEAQAGIAAFRRNGVRPRGTRPLWEG